MADLHTTDDKEKSDFERGFEAGESGDDLVAESLNEDEQEESDDSEPETDGGKGDPLSEDEDAEDDSESASDQSLPEEDESGENSDLSGTEEDEPRGSEYPDSFAEARNLLEQYFGKKDQPDQSEAASELVVIPEDIKSEAEAILKVNPQYEQILLEDSEDGQRFRVNLYEFGPEAAIGQLESAYWSRQTNSRVDSVVSSSRKEQVKAHISAISKGHPEYVELMLDPSKAEELQTFSSRLKGWAEELPYKEANEAFRVMESGNAVEVSDLLTRYKTATADTGNDPVDVDAARDVIAVPSKRKPARVSNSMGKTFESGFDAAVADEKRRRK